MYTNLLQLADTKGCGHYRCLFPAWSIRTINSAVKFTETQFYITDEKFYKHFTHVMVQRGVNDLSAKWFTEFVYPLSTIHGFWTSYNVDDAIGMDDIPKYNSVWQIYQNRRYFENIKRQLALVDFVVCTTETLKQYYVDRFSVNPDKIVTVPNYLPRWWVGEAYNINIKLEEYNTHVVKEKRPRIGFTSSLSHFDLNNQNNGIDDFTEICDFVRQTHKKYKWVFMGHCPEPLKDLMYSKQIEVHRHSDLLNFLREVGDKELQLIIAPLRDNTFNRCKSNIKLIEAWSLGIPFIGADLDPYSPYTEYTYKDLNQLQNQIDDILSEKNKFKKIIKSNRHVIDYGDKNSPNGWWLEKNLGTWKQLYQLPPKHIKIDYDMVFNSETGKEGVSISI